MSYKDGTPQSSRKETPVTAIHQENAFKRFFVWFGDMMPLFRSRIFQNFVITMFSLMLIAVLSKYFEENQTIQPKTGVGCDYEKKFNALMDDVKDYAEQMTDQTKEEYESLVRAVKEKKKITSELAEKFMDIAEKTKQNLFDGAEDMTEEAKKQIEDKAKKIGDSFKKMVVNVEEKVEEQVNSMQKPVDSNYELSMKSLIIMTGVFLCLSALTYLTRAYGKE